MQLLVYNRLVVKPLEVSRGIVNFKSSLKKEKVAKIDIGECCGIFSRGDFS